MAEARSLAARVCAGWPQQAEGWLWRAWLCEEPQDALAYAQRAAHLSPGAHTARAVQLAQSRLEAWQASEAARPAPPPRPPVWQDPRARRWLAGIATLLVAVLIVGAASHRAFMGEVAAVPEGVVQPTPTLPSLILAEEVPPFSYLTPSPNPLTTTLPSPTRVPTAVGLTEEMARALEAAMVTTSITATVPANVPTPVALPEDDILLDSRARHIPVVPATPTALPPPVARPADSPYALWPSRDYPAIYRVQSGDNLTTLAARFGLQATTLLWANEAPGLNPELLTIEQELVIPPLDGVLHLVQPGDSITSIAASYKVDPALIAWFSGNKLPTVDAPLQVGQRVMVPGGRKVVVAAPPAPSAPAVRGGASYFGWPTGGTITQTFSRYHGGIDIAGPMNSPIFASQSGEIIFLGWDTTGYGYTIVIDHHNGWYTRYAHLSGMYPAVGDWVKRGDLIALMGSTGRSTGPHLHFEIITNRYRYNPLSYLPK